MYTNEQFSALAGNTRESLSLTSRVSSTIVVIFVLDKDTNKINEDTVFCVESSALYLLCLPDYLMWNYVHICPTSFLSIFLQRANGRQAGA